MKYRVKVITYKSGRRLFLPQVKRWWGWKGIGYSGSTEIGIQAECDTPYEAGKCIKKHKQGNAVIKSVVVDSPEWYEKLVEMSYE